MDPSRTFFNSLKDFFLDIIGFLIPGIYSLFLLTFIFPYENFKNLLIPEYEVITLLTLTYIMGYIIFGISELFDKIFRYRIRIEKGLKEGPVYGISQIHYYKHLCKLNYKVDIKQISFRSVRNYCMSKFPEMDEKIYKFQFRSEFSNHIANISLIAFVIYLLIIYPFYDNCNFNFFTIILLFIGIILKSVRKRFFTIAQILPMTIYISNTNGE
ncbi:MAG: hypothetical protein KDC42_11975 [Ignavibacteriae bacterium]|nr:hypothetical protein [Ignavibacteriota bacterium]